MTREFPALGLILLFPLLGVIFNVFFGRRAGRTLVNWISPLAIFLAFGVSLAAFAVLLTMPRGAALEWTLWRWIQAGDFHVDIALRFDALTAVMTLVVTGVGAFIHLYSDGYMAHDADYARFFAYMNLFAFAMLILVLANNLLMMFVGWEGVGLCSYLLIAFWYDNPQFAYNGRKAFIANRIGDAGFLLGIFTITWALAHHGVSTLSFTGMAAHRELLAPVATLAALLLFLGATGKSAQIPLYVWLPDAMVGPTPVSALIHAATMVTAGVYMIARLNFLYILSPTAMMVVATVGAVTAFFAATIAVVQPDIKRVLAYSTISQIGYMMLGVGVGAFGAGIFHLMTHAFFKSLLFLCAGSVMHALAGEQDMNRMGGLRHKLPITWITMLIAALAISGIPPFSGFFSKDMVLQYAYLSGHIWLWALGVVTAGLTALYIFRLIFMTFHGSSRVEPERERQIHESPPVMTVPLIVLAIFATVGGWVGLPGNRLWGNAFGRFLSPAAPTRIPLEVVGGLPPPALSAIALAVALVGILIAWIFYLRSPDLPARTAESMRALYRLLMGKYYIDELYNLFVSRPLFWTSRTVLFRGVDEGLIDGIANGTGLGVEGGGEGLRHIESGNVQHYAFVYLLGALGIAAYYLYRVMH
ncbi:MAG TPA: NADH-quinone oxidoreductase subunit L [Candidatus Binataceae bacterium]|nr:NADH-quinone oxidoreductase subunit L [Candidatus Binataceae bacterium]